MREVRLASQTGGVRLNLMETRSQFCKEQGKMLRARGSMYKDTDGEELVGLRN